MLINDIKIEIKKDIYRESLLLFWTTAKPYTIPKEAPKIVIVIEYVRIVFLRMLQ